MMNSASVSSDSMIKVVPLWLIITRSNTCNMYKVGANISTLITMLNAPVVQNSRRNAHSARVSSERAKKPETAIT